jgi:hypothetical protein
VYKRGTLISSVTLQIFLLTFRATTLALKRKSGVQGKLVFVPLSGSGVQGGHPPLGKVQAETKKDLP